MRESVERIGLYTIYDRVAEIAGQPFLAANDGVAKREYKRLYGESPFASDFRLYKIAELDASNLVNIVNTMMLEVL